MMSDVKKFKMGDKYVMIKDEKARSDLAALGQKVEQNTSGIQEAKNSIAENARNIETNSSNISSNAQKINSNTQKINSNTQKINSNASDISANSRRIAALEKKYMFDNVIFIGDSFTLGQGATDIERDNYPKRLSEMVKINKWKRFNGSGFMNPGNGSQKYLRILNNEVWEYAKEFANDVTLVVVEGGWNDTYYAEATYTSIQPAVLEFFTEVKTKFPNAKIAYFFNPVSTFEDFNTPVYFGIYEAVSKLGVIKSDFSWGWIFTRTDYVTSDKLHPTTDGYNAIAVRVLNMLTGCDNTVTSMGGFFGEQSIPIYWEFANGIMHLFIEKTGLSGGNIIVADKCPIFMKPYKEKNNSFAIALINGFDVIPGYLVIAQTGAFTISGNTSGTNAYISISFSPLSTFGKRF